MKTLLFMSYAYTVIYICFAWWRDKTLENLTEQEMFDEAYEENESDLIVSKEFMNKLIKFAFFVPIFNFYILLLIARDDFKEMIRLFKHESRESK